VSQKVVRANVIDTFVYFQRIFKIISLTYILW